MKKLFLSASILFGLFLLFGCNQDEGLGGSFSIEGYVFKIVHYDDNLTFRKDTFPAAKEDVFLIFGNNSNEYFGDDVETDNNGFFRFNYLRPGNYQVYAFSELANSKKIAIYKDVKAENRINKVETIFINTGKAYGTSIVKGNVFTTYYHNGSYRDSGLGTGMRAYIKHVDENGYFDDVRVIDGAFYFQKLLPGTYEIGVETEDISTEAISLVKKTITITETGKVYEIPEVFNVNMSV